MADADAYAHDALLLPVRQRRRRPTTRRCTSRAGLNDPRVGFWEPAKWVAKLRAVRTNNAVLVLKTEMGAGHQGPSGRYEAWRDEARVQAFILSAVGLADSV